MASAVQKVMSEFEQQPIDAAELHCQRCILHSRQDKTSARWHQHIRTTSGTTISPTMTASGEVRLRAIWMTSHPPSVLWYCRLGLQTSESIIRDMTFTVSRATMNPTQPISQGQGQWVVKFIMLTTHYAISSSSLSVLVANCISTVH